jgi:hypothetical protein
MVVARPSCDLDPMAEVVIAFHRPPQMSASQMQEWVSDLTLAPQRALAVSAPVQSANDGLRLRVRIDDGAVEAGVEELADLMTDMRLLGLRPAVISSGV